MARLWRLGLAVPSLLLLFGILGCAGQPAAEPTTAPAAKAPAAATQAPAAPTQASAAAPAPTAAAASAPAEELRIGIMEPLTGAAARNGRANDRWVRFGIADVNAKGGLKVGGKTYKLVPTGTVDDKYTSEGGRDAANKLVLSEKVKYILGAVTNSLAGAQVVTEPAKVISIGAGAVDRSLGPANPFTVMVGTINPRVRVPALYDWVVKTYPQVKKIVYIHANDTNGQQYASIIDGVLQSKGITLLAKEATPLDAKDFSPLVTRVLRHEPEAIDISSICSFDQACSGLLRALYEADYRKPLYGSTGAVATLSAIGPAAEGFSFSDMADYNSSVVSQQERDAIKRYVDTYGAPELELVAWATYNSPAILAQAIEKAGTIDDTEKIMNALRQSELEVIWGKTRYVGTKTFGLPVLPEQPVYISKVQGGKVVTFDKAIGTIP